MYYIRFMDDNTILGEFIFIEGSKSKDLFEVLDKFINNLIVEKVYRYAYC